MTVNDHARPPTPPQAAVRPASLPQADGVASPGENAPRAADQQSPERIDWRAVFMVLPARRFTADELRRVMPARASRTFKVALVMNLLGYTALVPELLAEGGSRIAAVVALVLVALQTWLAVRLWFNPSGRFERRAYMALSIGSGVAIGALTQLQVMPREVLKMLLLLGIIGALALWFLMAYRYQYVALRLAELEERDRAVEMARRLTGAQLAPHFLFNTLASVQHWVATKDDRAGPLLADLTGYLRATLPMFDRPRWPLRDELEAVRRYLSVMQARLGAQRLQWRIEVDDELAGQPLPPGVVLTLVENAVGHGIEPMLSGGEVLIQARRDEQAWRLSVIDNGVGLPLQMRGDAAGAAGALGSADAAAASGAVQAAAAPSTTATAPAADAGHGVGLRNCRDRLLLLFGPQARLGLRAGATGGTVAEVTLPVAATGSPAPVASPSPAASPLA